MFNRATLAGFALLALFCLAGCGSSHHTAYITTPLNNGIAAFRIDDHSGKLTQIPGSPYPGGLSPNVVVVHPSGKFVYGSNRGHDSIAVFSVDPAKGSVTRIDNTSTQGRTPRNFTIDPSGKYLLAANQDTGNVVVFRIDPASGKLSPSGTEIKVPFAVCIMFLGKR